MPSTEPAGAYGAYRDALLQTARASIEHGLAHGAPLALEAQHFAPVLQADRACFVSLHLDAQLRGCIGSLEAQRPLIVDVAENAYAAAFRDPRFPPLSAAEFAALDVEISILSPPQALQFSDETELLEQLRPGEDGLILEVDHYRSTFLPVVWESLPERRAFVGQLKRKAGLTADYWSERIQFWRYGAERIY